MSLLATSQFASENIRHGNRRRLPMLPLWAAAMTVLGSVTVLPPASANQGCIPNDKADMYPRNARSGDNVCVPKNIVDTVKQENVNPSQNWVPNGAYGPQTCKSGLVWREAFDGDTVCVSPARRQETWQENANAGCRQHRWSQAAGRLQPRRRPRGHG